MNGAEPVTLQERKYLAQLVEGLAECVPVAEQWRVRAIKAGLSKLLRELYFDEERFYWGTNE